MNIFQSPIWSERRIHLFLLVGILLLAAFLRFHQLPEFPPGLFYDEAVNGLDAQRLTTNGKPLIFYPGNNGREPLHIYFQSLALLFFGNQAWSLRIASVFFGFLALPLLYCIARDLFRTNNLGRVRFIGTVAIVSLAFSYWHLSLSRLAFRAVYLLPLMIATLWLYWRGWQRQQNSLFIWSGIALGLSQYTYLPARLLPVILVLFALIQTIFDWRQQRFGLKKLFRLPQLQGLLIVGLISLIIFAPLGFYFKSHPRMFGQRVNSVTLNETNLPTNEISEQATINSGNLLQENSGKILRMFVLEGDLNGRHNLPGRPVFNIFSSIAFIFGFVVTLMKLKHPQSQFILLWLFIMLLPTLLSTEAPHYLRAIGALPPAVLLVAFGFTEIGNQLSKRLPLKPTITYTFMFGLFCLIGMSVTFIDYFQRWEEEADLNIAFSLGDYGLAQRTLELSQTNDVAVPMDLFAKPPFRFYIDPVFNQLQPIEELPFTNNTILLRAQTEFMTPNIVVLSRNGEQSGNVFIPQPLEPETVEKIMDINTLDIHSFEEYISSSPVQFNSKNINFGNVIALTGFHLEPLYPIPGETRIDLALNWHSLTDIDEDYVLFVHFVSFDVEKVNQIDIRPVGEAYPTYMWRQYDTFTDVYHFDTPSDIAPGKYTFHVGWIDVATGQRIPIVLDGNISELDYSQVGTVTIQDPAYANSPPTLTTDVSFGESNLIELTGYDLNSDRLAEENIVDLVLHWHTPNGVPLDYTIFIHILDESGELIAQSDSVPGSGRFPTSYWLAGETIYDRHQIQLPADRQLTDNDQITVGLYYWPTGERLPVFNDCGERQPNDRFVLEDSAGSCD